MDDSQSTAQNSAWSLPELKLVAPHGLEQILATFGNIHEYIATDGTLDPRWQHDSLATVTLPFPLRLCWDHSSVIKHVKCHKRLAKTFDVIFSTIEANKLQSKVSSFGGCFAFRQQRTGAKLSAHSWGIAIDLNPESNPQGSHGNMDPDLIEIFRDAGFTWGGDWPGKTQDPMHFQFCSGY